MASNNKIINICDNRKSGITDNVNNPPPDNIKKVTFDMTNVTWDSTLITFDNG